MAVARYLVDTSAVARLKADPVAGVIRPLVKKGLAAVCGVIALETHYSSRDAQDHARIRRSIDAREWLHTEDEDFDRAIEVQAELMSSGRHRAVPWADLLIAAVAERHRVTVLHYDSDFDMVTEVTGQPTLWVVPQGSVA
ncbi:MAG: PIN domain nuclease [Kribbellaceae bacterium]